MSERLQELVSLMEQDYPDWPKVIKADREKNPFAAWVIPTGETFSVIPIRNGLEIAFVRGRELLPFPDGNTVRQMNEPEQALEELKVYLRDHPKGKRK